MFKLKDVNGNCLYFGSSNHAEVSNWISKIHIIQAKYVSEVLLNLNLAFSEMISKFNSQYHLDERTNVLMKDPATIASFVDYFRALSKSRVSASFLNDLDTEDVESEVML